MINYLSNLSLIILTVKFSWCDVVLEDFHLCIVRLHRSISLWHATEKGNRVLLFYKKYRKKL